ncbi:NADH dehydrogenase subunit 5 (mitochondrion) [Procambarus clarkii]|uniref:NADH-ubiquinone oxidoreductase chain 5 n=1 Tax=Procambarus clarkii TaxID=6728 RepID=H6VY69_PROCL|nr:NADH dehydrogenase subunit 5 [Procambarus clarkii]AEV51232.1 nad5 [Procambarus clarkii]AKZ17606.1 NADH dehydrogenase subunit 5 [Procambarus clarkii]
MVWKFSMHLVSLVFLIVSSLLCLSMSLMSLQNLVSYVIEWELYSLNSSSIVVTLVFDWLSFMFLSFILFISSMVMFYSGGYMSGDKHYNRFMYLVLAFVISMNALIVSPNLISILLGWDGLGLISYVLVIYYQNEKSANAGMLTVLSNRVGDVAILLSIALFFSMGGWNFMVWSLYTSEDMILMKVLIVVAAMTKSAQIPFSAWLPAAMAAPTPVSALVHSSTLVTAGVYLLIRFSPIFEGASVQSFLLIISCTTMFMAGLGANFEYDLKKIIALSTLSQLGVMLSVLSLGFPDLAFFHLLTHALFKALLFLCAGVVIHSLGDYQDIRMMGGLIISMPLTGVCMNLSNLSLCGMPFMAGFYSKDLILEMAFMSNINFISFIMYILATGLTVSYTFRLIFYSLTSMSHISNMSGISDNDFIMTNPMVMLSLSSILSGASLSWVMFPEYYMICLSSFMKSLVLLLLLIGSFTGYMLNIMSLNETLSSLGLYFISSFSGSMWFMPFLSSVKLNYYILKLGKSYDKIGDKGWSEYFGGQGGFSVIMKGSYYLEVTQGNMIKIYMKSFFLWVTIVVIMLVLI